MTLICRFAWATTVLLALLIAGCGSEKPATQKSAKPAAPAPVKMAEPATPVPITPGTIAWGEAVNGLQIGLTSKNYQFVEGESIAFELNFKNLGDSDLMLWDAGHVFQWRFTFVPEGSGETLMGQWNTGNKVDRLAVHVVVPKGKVGACPIEIEYHCFFQGSRQSFDCLPPGKYTVTATYEHAVHPTREGEACPYWHGKIITSAVEVEVTPKQTADIAWGEAVDDLRLGLARPQGSFQAGEPMCRPLFLENLSNKFKQIHFWRSTDVVSHDFEVVIRNQDGSAVPIKGQCCKSHVSEQVFIKPKGVLRLKLDLLNQMCCGVRELAPGKYTATVGYGKVTTGPVEIEIKPKAADAAPATIAWGEAVNGLQVGLVAVSYDNRPCSWVFGEGEPLTFKVHLRNVGDSAKGVSGIHFDDFFFQPKGGGATLRSRWLGPNAAPPVKLPPPLEAGRGLEFPLTVGGEDWHFEDASQPRQEVVAAPVRFLAPGRYSVTVGSTPGRIPSGTVQIEIGAKAGPKISEQRAREIALAAATEKWPDWRKAHLPDRGDPITSVGLQEGKRWQVRFFADDGIAGHAAGITVDAQTGKILEFKVIPTD